MIGTRTRLGRAMAAVATVVMGGAPAYADLGDQLYKLLPDVGAKGDQFGRSVAISGATALVGAYLDRDNGTESGSAYLFDTATGQQITKLLPDDGEIVNWFGWSVAISGDTAVVGAQKDSDNGDFSGSAYLFDTTTGEQVAKLLADDGAAFDNFGFSVGVSGDTAIIGAPNDDDACPADPFCNSGSAYLFDTTTGEQVAKLLADDGAAGDGFGVTVAISGATAIVGARNDDDNGTSSGSAYLFDISDPKNPVQIAKLLPDDGATFDRFGWSVAISGATAIVGAPWDDDDGDFSGSAYLFDTTTGEQIAKLLADDGATQDLFGEFVAIGSEIAIVGAWGDDDNGSFSGSAYLFDATTGDQIAKLLPDDGAAGDEFGWSVGISGPTAIIGAWGDDENGTWSGSAYLFAAGTSVAPAELTACSITFGSTDNPPCDVGNLIDDDNVDQILRSQFGFSAFERNLTEIVINGNGADATTITSIETRDGSDTTNVVAKVKARNYVSNVIDDIAQYDVSFPSDDTSHSTQVNSTDYVDINGDIEVRLRYVAPATFTPLGFTVGLDQVEVMVN